jgi:hypothetical protein
MMQSNKISDLIDLRKLEWSSYVDEKDIQIFKHEFEDSNIICLKRETKISANIVQVTKFWRNCESMLK